jgi:hypothetical protein
LALYSTSIVSHTWKKDSHGLFDREDSNKTIEDFITTTEQYLIRKSNGKVKMLPKSESIKEMTTGDTFLCKIVPSETVSGRFIVENCNQSESGKASADKLWLDISSIRQDNKSKVLQ